MRTSSSSPPSPKGNCCILGFAAAVLAVLAAGCGSNSPSHDAQAADTASTQDALVASPPYCTLATPSTALADMSGTWVMRAEGSQVVNAPTIGKLQTKSIFYILVSINQTGTLVRAEGNYCDRAEVDDPRSPVKVVIPDAWAHTETPVVRTGSFVPGVDGVGVLTIDPLPEVAGAVLANSTDSLPTDPSDPRVVDSDNDGNSGITVSLTGIFTANLYSVQRQTTSFVGIPVAADRVEGTLSFTSEQTVLGSTNPNVTALYRQSQSGPDPIVCDSTFAMVRVFHSTTNPGAGADGGDVDGGGVETAADGGGAVDGGVINCDWVRAREAALFPTEQL